MGIGFSPVHYTLTSCTANCQQATVLTPEYNESLLSGSSALDVTSAVAANSAGLQQQTRFENLEHSASMIQQQVSTTQMLQHAFDNCEIKIFLTEICLSHLPRPFLGILVGSSLVALVCCGGFLALSLVAYLPSRKTPRFQHMHDGRMVYEWDQTSTVATIYITPPEGVKESDLDIRIAAQHLRVGRKGKSSFLREETYDFVNEQLSSWSMRSTGELQISLHKLQRAEWPVVLLHNEKSGGPGLHFAAMNSKTKV